MQELQSELDVLERKLVDQDHFIQGGKDYEEVTSLTRSFKLPLAPGVPQWYNPAKSLSAHAAVH